ncbi:vWA domain-containing protein [Stieleria varia]|uniref:von Willebrand factor type A domain protein n=1 Tax=Stieleria varia TaxID=2528005 RepID=A0A5C6ARM5_9BACT|nr:VWA domain-containing protein [Stieleria varia]TWU02625.1 von Willebrand factor type A domain protein [Stieleria varia]
MTELQRVQNRHGVTMVLIVILLPALFALAAFAINVSQMESVGTEVQIAADAAARAAGKVYAITGDESLALQAAQEAAAKNPVGGFVVPIASTDLEFGISDRASSGDAYSFVPAAQGNAVRLTTRTLATSSSGIKPVFPFFGSSFDIRPERVAVSTQGVIDIALVVDRSGSMAYSSWETAAYPPKPHSAPYGWDFGDTVPNHARWLDLLGSVQTFIGELNTTPTKELMSLTMYNHNAATAQPLTDEYQLVVDQLGLVSQGFDAGGTNIGGGMQSGLNSLRDPAFARPEASKVILLMTDGVHNYGTNPLWAADSVADAGVTLFAVTFSNEADQVLMQQVAEKCGGEHFHAINATQLQDAFRQIARRLPTLLTQ